MRRRLALLVPLSVLAFGSAGAAGPARTPAAVATAWAIHVTVPGGTGAATPVVRSPPGTPPATGGVFSYPADGSVVSAQSTLAAATAKVLRNAGAKAESDVTSLSLFGGEITADAVIARASAGTGPSGAGGNADGSTVVNLKVLGQSASGPTVALGGWGTLTLGAESIDRSAPQGAQAYRGHVVELDVRLTADHGGLSAGSEIQIGYAEAAAQTVPFSQSSTTTTTTETTTTGGPSIGDRPTARPLRPGRARRGPLKLTPKLSGGPYVFPVYGSSSYVDTFGAPRAGVRYHHGTDVFGQLGQPLVACANGTIFSVGWEKLGGWRLWLLDSQGNQYYYAHLSAFSTLAVNGAHVKAGQVIGFMGHTGDAETTAVHLHFEIHPVSLLYLGYDGAVDPTTYLDSWRHEQDLPLPIAGSWLPILPGGGPFVPEPGAILLGMSDISTADGLDPASLRLALRPSSVATLMQTLVPTGRVPAKALGHG